MPNIQFVSNLIFIGRDWNFKLNLTFCQQERLNNYYYISRGTFYESGDRAGHLFAQRLKSRNASNQIKQICNNTGAIISDPGEINHIFREFYFQLYNSESLDSGIELSQLDMPKISLEDQILDSPLKLSEITEAIWSIHLGLTGFQCKDCPQ